MKNASTKRQLKRDLDQYKELIKIDNSIKENNKMNNQQIEATKYEQNNRSTPKRTMKKRRINRSTPKATLSQGDCSRVRGGNPDDLKANDNAEDQEHEENYLPLVEASKMVYSGSKYLWHKTGADKKSADLVNYGKTMLVKGKDKTKGLLGQGANALYEKGRNFGKRVWDGRKKDTAIRLPAPSLDPERWYCSTPKENATIPQRARSCVKGGNPDYRFSGKSWDNIRECAMDCRLD